MNLLVGQCLQDVHLIKKKINVIITEEKIIEKLCKKLKESAMKIIDYEEKEMIPLTHEKNKFYKEQEAYHISYKNKRKVKDHCHHTGKCI